MRHLTREEKCTGTMRLMMICVLLAALCVACGGQKEESTPAAENTKSEAVAEVTREVREEEEEEREEVILSEEEIFALYAKQIEALEERYGKPALSPYPHGVPGSQWYYLRGLSYLKLVDFDGDGTEELVACYWESADETPMMHIYGIADGECREVFSKPLGGDGSPVIFEAMFSEYEELPCVVQSGTQSCNLYAYQDGEMSCVVEGMVRSDLGRIELYSDYYAEKYYSGMVREATTGYMLNYDSSYRALIQAEQIRLFTNDVRALLQLDPWESFAFVHPGIGDYYVSTADEARGMQVPERLLFFFRHSYCPRGRE